MRIGPHSFEKYLEKVKEFHGSIAPGIVAGGIMIDLARAHLPDGEIFDTICETPNCLPDAVQLLTPCTIGNRWLKIVDTGRYALSLYSKYTGQGVRVFLDASKLDDWPAVRAWFLREKPKKAQALEEILDEFRRAGTGIYAIQRVKVKKRYLPEQPKTSTPIGMCPSCGEPFKGDIGRPCPACRGEGPYEEQG